jgi:RNA polymerase sigma-70 factor (ECF subfamily)
MSRVVVDIDFDDLRRRLERAVSRVCPHWLSAQADDIVQVALMRLMEKGEGIAHLGSSYLWRVAFSVTVDEIRKARRRHETGLDESAGATERAVTPAADPEERAASRQLGLEIRACLGRLSRDRRLALTLHLQGHSVPETARLLGWPSKKTENLVYRGLADLRACLSSKGLKP